MHYDTVRQLQEFIETKNSIYLFSSTGTGFMEASVRNCVRNKMIVCVNGSFGQRFADVAKANGKKVVPIITDLGEPIQPEMIEAAIEREPEVEAVAITHNETSTGLINDLPKLTKVCQKYDMLVFVDGVSSMGGTEIKVDKWGIDICFSSSQKCFGVPPGVGIGSVSKRVLDISAELPNKGWYFDFNVWEKKHIDRKGTPMTSVIPQIAGINTALKLVDKMGGKKNYFKLFKKRNTTIRQGIKRLGLDTFPKKGYESPTVSCITAPVGMSGSKVYKEMRKHGFELAEGYGKLKNITFRIGNMGWIPDIYINEMLEALGKVV
jgi:aspartate aminotransferase-like enzyme